MADRKAAIKRDTLETQIQVSINLDGSGNYNVDTGVPFLDHMLDQVARHGLIDLDIKAKGDLHIDAHHTVEDVGITLGQAFAEAIGDKKGIRRYGHAYVPLDEALSRVVIDFSGRPYGHAYVPLDEALSRVVIDFSGRPGMEYGVEYTRARVGDFDMDLLSEFFQGFINHAQVTLHIDNIRGKNAHHIAETVFKAFGRAVRMAIEMDSRMGDTLPSTKGSL
jgi:imidazoleglycerol-phosphate dehydratase